MNGFFVLVKTTVKYQICDFRQYELQGYITKVESPVTGSCNQSQAKEPGAVFTNIPILVLVTILGFLS